MQQPITRRDVYEPSVQATVNGSPVEVSSVRVERALPDPLVRGELRAASATFSTVEGDDVVSVVATPWDPGTAWPPVPQSPVSLSMDMGAGPVSILGGGVVAAATGGASKREVTIEASDAYESLNRTISWDAVAANMPGIDEASLGRYVSMNTTAITDHILRYCGWYSTPPSPGYTMLSVPAQGSMWPERGYVTLSGRQGGGYPYWVLSNWGVAVADVDATYTLAGGGYTLTGRGGVELTAMTQRSSSSSPGTMYLDVQVGDPYGASIRLSWTDDNAFVRLRNPSGDYFTATSVPRANGLTYASIKYVSATSVQVTLRSGENSSEQIVTVASGLTSGEMRVARIWGQGVGGGFVVAAPSRMGTLEGWEPSAVLYPRTSNRNSLRIRPPVEGENCSDLLAQQCEAEMATYWIDELGILRWWDRERLEGQATVGRLTSDDDITDPGFTWSHDLSQVKSGVSVKWREPLVQQSWRTSIDLWQGRGETLQGGDVLEGWISVPDEEVWIMPDLTLARLGDAGQSMDDYNYGLFSHYGGVVEDTDTWAQLDGSLLMTVERVTDAAFKTWIQWTGSQRVVMRTPSTEASSALWMRRRNLDLPILRGKAKWTMTDQITYSTQSGPSVAPEHEIKADWWIQSQDQAQYTADYAGDRLTVPQPVLSAVSIIPTPGLQLGDVVEVQDSHVTRLTVRGFVVDDSRSVSDDMSMSHSVAIRPTHVTRDGHQWHDWGAWAQSDQWATWGQRQQPDTWRDWGRDPLEED